MYAAGTWLRRRDPRNGRQRRRDILDDLATVRHRQRLWGLAVAGSRPVRTARLRWIGNRTRTHTIDLSNILTPETRQDVAVDYICSHNNERQIERLDASERELAAVQHFG